ncbi:hypothetical protein E8E11_008192 [Didymella keratinophila]|nr:hypothetical protein E8E11_008192 [Didymella keratinophila]
MPDDWHTGPPPGWYGDAAATNLSYNPTSEDGTGYNFSNLDSIFADFLKTSGGAMDDDDDDFAKAFDHTKAGKRPTDGKASPKPDILIVKKPLAITLEEMFKGVTKNLRVKRKTFDPTTNKESTEERILEVPIKKGPKAGSKIKLSGKPHALFRRNGDDIHHTVQINVLESLCGWTRTVPSTEGSTRQISTTGETGPEWKHTFPYPGFPNSKKLSLKSGSSTHPAR